MDDKAIIPFGFCAKRLVIVNAVTVKCQRGITKQQNRIRVDDTGKRACLGRLGWNWGRRTGLGCFAIDDIVLFLDPLHIAVKHLMAHCHENQIATASSLMLYRSYG